ncbi:type I restriction endonuclease subunit R [Deinococcus radiophilus]|uniref:type I restriction endonuclease subunit R n=1 Tax=Deinococcus radiophilus TaxID=32062 RepID=UPI001E58368B|nr:HsdR family type I site-specific deoxyribonuclease [Deinococcus radiophilus]UFA51988.1 HsdR family type I site-specific deoxyribonuclease [Deinococcus radiophilus]
MTTLRPETKTQQRVLKLLQSQGYDYLGDWKNRRPNKCIEAELLTKNLQKRGYSPAHISQALQQLTAAADTTGVTLYQANLRTYSLLRYGVKVQVAAGMPHDTVHLIDWDHPERNDFAVAEEVTLKGGHERRPDVVIYINGLALVVLELKRGSVEVADGVRQLITNQEAIFNESFFSTVQLLLAGNDSQGLFYGTVGTPEEFFVRWKALERADLAAEAIPEGHFLDEPLAELCDKARLLDMLHNFVIFDGGRKKVPRMHQFEAIKAAQERIKRYEGGVIWHTQGSGKSILMVLLAKWILEHEPDARILIFTDRDELDKQIEGVLRNTGVVGASAQSTRVSSRADLIEKLADPGQRVMSALLHKIDARDLSGERPHIAGKFYIFVDEAHRTQGGNMNRQMKRWFQGAIFVGFTGTPLLKQDKEMTTEVFGTFIHTYKFDEAVEDKVVLDLKYEARNVPQRLTSPELINDWFDAQTRSLNSSQKALLKMRWANMEKLMSSEGRKRGIVFDIVKDFGIKPRFISGRGTAILVAPSIYDACHYYRMFQQTPLGPHTALITSYQPNHNNISREPAGSDERYKFDTYTQHVLGSGQTTKQYEDEMKRRFIEEPENCKLLIVVSKLLTGFDAPSCTYIYLDNELHDHNLFQAICRTNRLDGADKDYGHVVDYKELFKDVQNAIAVYTSDQLATDAQGDDGNVILKDWKAEGKAQLDAAHEALRYLCEPVSPPQQLEQFISYFCGDILDAQALADTEPLRISFYKASAAFLRAYAAVAQVLVEAGYTPEQAAQLEKESAFYSEMRQNIKKASGEELDIKPYEQGMRQLINMYIQADPAQEVGQLSEMTLVQAIVETGINDVIAQHINKSGRYSNRAVAETIVNNVRKTIIRDQLTDPRFYEQMSDLLDDLIKQHLAGTLAYEDFLRETEQLIRALAAKGQTEGVPSSLMGRQAATVIFNNLGGLKTSGVFSVPENADERAQLALDIDQALKEQAPAAWRGDEMRQRQVKNILHPLMSRDRDATEALFELIFNLGRY